MARTWITGFELGGDECYQEQGTYQTTYARSGTYGLRFSLQAQNQQYARRAAGSFANVALSARFYIRLLALPSTTNTFFQLIDTTPTAFDRLRLDSSGYLIVTDGTNSASSNRALSVDGLWHRIEFDCGWNAGAGRRVFVDGSEWASTGLGAATVKTGIAFGWIDTNPGDIVFDDLVLDDASFSTSGSPSDSQVSLLLPVSDSSIGTWTGGAGGTTSVFQGIDNIPPVGLANASGTNASQIKNANASANQDGKFSCQSYTTAGISGTVHSVMAVCNDGASANTIAGGVWLDSNPAQTAGGNSFDYGNASTVAGTFPTGWKSHVGPVSVEPSVTLGTSPVVAVRKTTATASVAHVDFLGVYVEWTPAPVIPSGTPLTTPAFSPKFLFFDTGDFSPGL